MDLDPHRAGSVQAAQLLVHASHIARPPKKLAIEWGSNFDMSQDGNLGSGYRSCRGRLILSKPWQVGLSRLEDLLTTVT